MPSESDSLGLSDLSEVISGGDLDLSWQDWANCRGADPDLFFSERGASTRPAKAICKECHVREECLEYAIVSNEKFGIWGMMSERERRRIRSERYSASKREKAGT